METHTFYIFFFINYQHGRRFMKKPMPKYSLTNFEFAFKSGLWYPRHEKAGAPIYDAAINLICRYRAFEMVRRRCRARIHCVLSYSSRISHSLSSVYIDCTCSERELISFVIKICDENTLFIVYSNILSSCFFVLLRCL